MYSQPQLKRNCGGCEVEEGEESNSMNYCCKNKERKLFLFNKNVLSTVQFTIQYLSVFSQNDLMYIKHRNRTSPKSCITFGFWSRHFTFWINFEKFYEEQSKGLIYGSLQHRNLYSWKRYRLNFRRKKGRNQVSHTFKKCLLHFSFFSLLFSLFHLNTSSSEGKESFEWASIRHEEKWLFCGCISCEQVKQVNEKHNTWMMPGLFTPTLHAMYKYSWIIHKLMYFPSQ